jgi:hypothetical protein
METLCCIKGCDLKVHTLGLCVNHWRMNVKHGSPVAERPLSAINRGLSDEHRFWKSVEKTDGCWLWRAGRDEDGYGVFQAEIFGVSVFRAHRYSHMLATGEILAPRILVMHACDNPPCVNPAHLSSGTHKENADDMVAKGRHLGRSRIHADKIAKLSDEQVRAILRDPRPYAQIAATFAVHPQTIMGIKSRTTRFHVEIDPSEIVRAKRGSRGEAKSKLLTDNDVRMIRASEDRTSTLARQYGVSPQTITDIRKGRSWKHVIGDQPVDFATPSFDTSQSAPAVVPRAPRSENTKLCSVEGCVKPVKAHGLCHTHYVRVRRTGEIGTSAPLPKNGPKGAAHHKAALTESQAREIKFSAEKGADLARRFNVKPSVISSIRHGHTWKHLEPEMAKTA